MATDNSQPGFMEGISNLFDAVSTYGGKAFDVYGNWLDRENLRSQQEAQSEIEKLQANVAISAANAQMVTSEQLTRMIGFGIVGLVGIGGAIFLFRFLK